MKFNNILTELEDIPIRVNKPNPTTEPERVEPRKQERDPEGEVRVNLNDYVVKTGRIFGNSDEELDKNVDTFLAQSKNRMSMVYNYSEEDGKKIAHIALYNRDVSNLNSKYQKALKNKIELFANTNSKGNTRVSDDPKEKQKISVNNIQKAIAQLSERSLKDLDRYVNALVTRDSLEK